MAILGANAYRPLSSTTWTAVAVSRCRARLQPL